MDYKPIDTSFPNDPFASSSNFVSEVKDFKAGIVYRTDSRYGNCTPSVVGFDPTGDVGHNADGTISMTSPFEMWHLNQKYAYNGGYTDRSIYMDFYVSETWEGVSIGGEMGRENYTTVMALSSGTYEIEGDGGTYRQVPVKMERYPNDEYNNPYRRTIYNIIGFDAIEPDMDLFDISGCFVDEQMDRRAVRLGWHSDMDVENDIRMFRDQIRAQVIKQS